MKSTLLFLIALPFFGLAQNTETDSLSFGKDIVVESNSIIFGEMYVGVGGSNNLTTAIGVNLNFQFNKDDLLTARFSSAYGAKTSYLLLFPYSLLLLRRSETVLEYGVLYGKRYVFKSSSFSFSGGIAYYNRDFYQKREGGYTFEHENYFGFPFELNYKLFKGRKKRFRAYYGLIPVGKEKVAFGRSIGFKLYGDISRNSHFGFGITYGFGTHKDYSRENP
ncbi:MAG: hypothetical protein WCY89_04775 [Flavobacteriaceae bacterium]